MISEVRDHMHGSLLILWKWSPFVANNPAKGNVPEQPSTKAAEDCNIGLSYANPP